MVGRRHDLDGPDPVRRGGGTQDGDTYGWFNDALPTVPWGIDYDRCNAAEPGCDPKELWAPSVAFVGTTGGVPRRKVARAGLQPLRPLLRSTRRWRTTCSGRSGPRRRRRSSAPTRLLDVAGAIDPDVFVDEVTGKAYLLWKTEGNLRGNYPAIWPAS
ncbi:MAG: hypothetical protein R2711_01110 [Acidimicrobiales bacterium]